MELAARIGRRIVELFIESRKYRRSGLAGWCAIVVLDRVGDMAHDVREKDSPGFWLVTSGPFPHPDIECRMEAFLGNPTADHLYRVLVSLSGGWDD